MQKQNSHVNNHFKAADRMAAMLPSLITQPAKRMQQRAILRELAAGLRMGSK